MERFGRFYLDKEKDIIVDLYRADGEMRYVLRTPNHRTGNLITNLAKLCDLPIDFDEGGLKVVRGTVPCYVDGSNRRLYIFRMGNTKIANIFPDGTVELKASIPSISKTLMSQTKDYQLSVAQTIVKTYLFDDCKFRTDLHTHMNGNLEPDVLIALGIHHQIRYPLYYIRKLGLRCTAAQQARLASERARAAAALKDSPLTGRYLDRRIDDNTFINFADLILNNPGDAEANIARIRVSLAVPKDGQAVFADLEKVYLYRYVFTKGTPAADRLAAIDPLAVPDADVARALAQMSRDRENPDYRDNTLFQDKLLWIARGYRAQGVEYAEITDTALVKRDQAAQALGQIHAVMPAVTRETGVLLRFLAGIRRIPLTIVRDNVTPSDYLAENLRVLRAVAPDPYVAGSDIIGEEINSITELRGVIREVVSIAAQTPGFVIRIHAGENDSLRDNVRDSIRCVREALAPGQPMPRLRIGHGLYTCDLRSPRGRRLIQEILDSGAALEFQITSNVRLNNLSDLSRHPLKQYLREGIPCVQGTDSAALFGTNSIDEELSLEKLLGLSHDELRAMRRAEQAIQRDSLDVFARRREAFERLCAGEAPAAVLARRILETPGVQSTLWLNDGKLDAQTALRDRIAPLPAQGMPVIVAGGSFSGAGRPARVRPDGLKVIDALLERADPEKVFFVVGHRLSGYEHALVERAAGRFSIFAIVPSALSAAERARLWRSGVGIRVSIEPSGNSLYKSFAYEIFKRRPSALLAFDGRSPVTNLVQEAKNGRFKCDILVDDRCRALGAKVRTLKGYVRTLGGEADPVGALLERHGLARD